MKTHGCRYHIKTFFHPGFSYTYLGDIVDPQPYYFGSKMPVLAGSLSYYFGSKMPFFAVSQPYYFGSKMPVFVVSQPYYFGSKLYYIVGV